MCVNPIYIKNLSKAQYGGLEYISVPCRNCPECSASAQQDYLTRTIALCNSLPENYSFFFCTLTFNNDNLPRTNVYRIVDGEWQVIATAVPCFNHQIYKRFRKNFTEYCTDTFGQQCYLLSTCEYGEKFHRPHYHLFCAFPAQVSWRQFKVIIEKYWHYGFTKNVALCQVDNQYHTRSLLNCVKYVTKYVCKFEQKWLPVYLKDKSLSTDFPPYEITPKVFISNHYGSALENSLSVAHYMNNSIFMQLKLDKKDKGKDYSLPSYYRRRFFTSSLVISKERFNPQPQGFPWEKNFPLRPKYRMLTQSIRKNGYTELLYRNFQKKLRSQIYDYFQLLQTDENFVSLLQENFSSFDLSFSLYDDVLKCYCESSDTHYKVVRLTQYKVHNVNYDQEYSSSIFRYAKHIKEKMKLPWLPLPFSHSWLSKRRLPFSHLPDDYMKIEFAQHYLRNLRQHQYLLREANELDWYRLHHVTKSA